MPIPNSHIRVDSYSFVVVRGKGPTKVSSIAVVLEYRVKDPVVRILVRVRGGEVMVKLLYVKAELR